MIKQLIHFALYQPMFLVMMVVLFIAGGITAPLDRVAPCKISLRAAWFCWEADIPPLLPEGAGAAGM